MSEKVCSAGYWPANSIYDIENARAKLQKIHPRGDQFILIAHPTILRPLRSNIHNAATSYMEYLLNNQSISAFYEFADYPQNEAVIYATRGGWPFTKQTEKLTTITSDSFIQIINIHSHYSESEENSK